MEYEVIIRRVAQKQLSKLPLDIQQRFHLLVSVLKGQGPTAPHQWRNYGKLKGQKNSYHCHLANNHAYVACWEYQKNTITIEVDYVGSHKDAPY